MPLDAFGMYLLKLSSFIHVWTLRCLPLALTLWPTALYEWRPALPEGAEQA